MAAFSLLSCHRHSFQDTGAAVVHPLEDSIPQLTVEDCAVSYLLWTWKKLLEMVPGTVNLLCSSEHQCRVQLDMSVKIEPSTPPHLNPPT